MVLCGFWAVRRQVEAVSERENEHASFTKLVPQGVGHVGKPVAPKAGGRDVDEPG